MFEGRFLGNPVASHQPPPPNRKLQCKWETFEMSSLGMTSQVIEIIVKNLHVDKNPCCWFCWIQWLTDGWEEAGWGWAGFGDVDLFLFLFVFPSFVFCWWKNGRMDWLKERNEPITTHRTASEKVFQFGVLESDHEDCRDQQELAGFHYLSLRCVTVKGGCSPDLSVMLQQPNHWRECCNTRVFSCHHLPPPGVLRSWRRCLHVAAKHHIMSSKTNCLYGGRTVPQRL